MERCVNNVGRRTRHLTGVGLLAWMLGGSGLETRLDAQGTGSITGTVVARQGGGAVADAVVMVDGTNLTAVSNGVGRFRLDGVSPGNVVLVVQAPGFLDLRAPAVQVRANEPTAVNIELEVTPNFMDRVQVTATKGSLSIGEVAAQADIVDKTTIDLRGDQTLPQAIAHVPGAVISTQLGIFESVTLRGMPRDGLEFTNTLLLVDGVPQTMSSNSARVVALPINDASGIEIVRGPNSALYGRTAIGGSVNVLTASPTATPEYGFDFTGGELGMLKGVGRASGPLSRWGGFYVSASSERNSGYFVDKTTSDFQVDAWSLFGKMTFSPNTKGSGSISVNRVDSDNFTPTNEPIIDGEFLHNIDPRFDRFTNFNIPGPNYHQGETRVTLNYTHAFSSWARGVEVFGYRDVQHKFIDDGDFIGSPYDLAATTASMYPFSQELNENIAYQEFRLELTPKTQRVNHMLTIGGSYEWNSGDLFSDFIYNDEELFGFTINYLNPVIPPRSEWQHDTGDRVYHVGIAGIFAQYMVEPTSRWVLTAGGRYDRLDMDNSRNGGDKIEDTFDAFSPKVSATFKLLGYEGNGMPTVNIYGAYSQAFLPPRRPSSLIPADVPLNLKPEDIDNYEVGVKASLADSRVALEATFFRMSEKGVVLTTQQGPFFFPTNAGEVKYKGVETGVRFSVSPKVSVYTNASFYRNRFGDFVIQSEDGDTVLNGNRLPMASDYVVNWGANFTPASTIDARFDVKHVGDVQTNRDNTFKLDPYTVVDAAVSWLRGPVRLTLSAHNLFDTDYYWLSDGDTADPARPRQVLFTTSFQFR
jgi:iron complex outermembrane recepter protein